MPRRAEGGRGGEDAKARTRTHSHTYADAHTDTGPAKDGVARNATRGGATQKARFSDGATLGWESPTCCNAGTSREFPKSLYINESCAIRA